MSRSRREGLSGGMKWLRACICVLLILRELHSAPITLNSADESFTSGLYQAPEDAKEWKLWKGIHNKSYASSIEDLERYSVWHSNTAYIRSHNAHSQKFGFTLSMNGFGDLTLQEYIQTIRCENVNGAFFNWTYFDSNAYANKAIMEEVDWRSSGVVTDVKNQGRCRSCYAFSVAGALEGMHALSTGQLVPVSEQNIIDCSVPYGNRGCSGGSRENSILYVIDSGGIDTQKSYPYSEKQGLCKFNSDKIGALCTGMTRIKKRNETELKAAVAMSGPISVAIDARRPSFQFYDSGIYNEPYCSQTKLIHSMLIIGYGTKKGLDYWILKNSWGTTWGMSGYILMSRNKGNQCGIATRAIVPT